MCIFRIEKEAPYRLLMAVLATLYKTSLDSDTRQDLSTRKHVI